MTLQLSTTICSTEEGFAFLRTEEGLCIAQGLKRRCLCELTPTAWEELKAFVDTATGPVVGFIGYEMGAYVDLRYPLPFHRPSIPSVIFYELETLEEIAALPATNLHTWNLPLLARSDSEASYLHKIEILREKIAAGEVYQVNLSQAFTYKNEGVDSWALFSSLYARQPSPYAAYLQCGSHAICSLSPELFIRRRGALLCTRPIKGTAPRGGDGQEDERLKEGLLRSAKERAELLMITDLMRNDLHRVCERGSVKTHQMWELESYRDVFHLVSTLTGVSKGHPVDVVRQLFPAGSITGCPKRAAIEVIAELEGRARGVYTGAMGVFYPSGDFSFNVAIRTLTIDAHEIVVQMGGGILYDSEGKKEYEETLHKGRTFFEILGAKPCQSCM